ncbi:T9SS type A sorting domain-containing protein [Aequorivita sp. H23M31]|uniref:T9SS type A sorting domain-containing protein n=1 Tax=Aequorivita ciconiae TaxID=2494375 RepID=A0A410FZC5_9FLAO|nr:T9SS type A sorting domain-containing protein [Aequorivita sp. H23M31]QAA80372.1 T9SS type A sorting domain-containing protein [Aequorivita sp. H23M31]
MKKTYFLIALSLLLQISSFANSSTLATLQLTTRLTEDYPLEMPQLKAYPIYMNATAQDPDTISEVRISIDGSEYNAEENIGFYYFLWTPESYGIHEIVMTAKSTTGEEISITRNINVVSTASTQMVASLEDVVIEFGGDNSRWYYGTYTFPQFVGGYNDINAFLDVACPNITGGCDDWDRWAFIDVKAPDGNWIQLIRYITPYGVACSHELNVTDYKSLLQGEVELRVFIDTWGTGGWQLSLDMNFAAGTPEYLYSDVIEIWDDSYSFGDPANLQPVPTFNVEIPELVNASHLRVSNTGHNWGANNSGNAAEFFNATHYLDINGEQTFSQHLWNQCNPNPDGCTGQRGTWQYSRAGWCPGSIAPPDVYDMSAFIGTAFNLDYRFHPSYMDYCHPNNPDCVSGQTCPDCNDGSNPIYYVDTHLINESNNPMVYGNILGIKAIDNTKIFDISVYPNPTKGMFQINTKSPDGETRITVNTVDGQAVKTYYFQTSEELNHHSFDLTNLSSGIYFLNIENSYGTGVKRIILE